MKQIIQPEQSTQLSFKHYPILSAFFKEYGLFQLFDSLLPKNRHFQVTHGQCILLFLCDCLTARTPLYLYTNLVERLDVEMIFGSGVKSSHFNEYAMGETLDAIQRFGESRLFALVLEHLRKLIHLDVTHLHADTTNFSVAGEYDDGGITPTGLHITFGHAKDKRTDLKRWALLMIANAQGIPVAMKTLDGNSSDKITIIEGMKALQEALSSEEMTESIYIADSAFYTKENIVSFRGNWISHAPEKLKEVKKYMVMKDLPFITCTEKEYQVYGFNSSYEGIKQRWVLVYSQQMYNRQEKTLQRNQEKQLKEAKSKAYHLQAQIFKCEPDALAAAAKIIAIYPLLEASEPELSTKSVSMDGKRGRPKKGEEVNSFSVCVTFTKDPLSLEQACSEIGKFMLVTNDFSLEDEQILDMYKNQQSVERGFRFLKDGTLKLTPVFLKSPGRIQALSFVMCFSLMVYAIIENKLRESLSKQHETIHIQDTGPADYRDNAKPTLNKIFALFDNLSTTFITMPGGDQMLIRSSLSQEVMKVLNFLGSNYEQAFDRRG